MATFAPEATTLRLPGPANRESARNHWPGTVLAVTATASSHVDVTVELARAGAITVPVTRESAVGLELQPGTRVVCVTKALSVHIHPKPHTGMDD